MLFMNVPGTSCSCGAIPLFLLKFYAGFPSQQEWVGTSNCFPPNAVSLAVRAQSAQKRSKLGGVGASSHGAES